MRIVCQYPRENGVLTEFEDGTSELRPYLIDENGMEYVDLDPNNEWSQHDHEIRYESSSLRR